MDFSFKPLIIFLSNDWARTITFFHANGKKRKGAHFGEHNPDVVSARN
jgi:hypothetical protein